MVWARRSKGCPSRVSRIWCSNRLMSFHVGTVIAFISSRSTGVASIFNCSQYSLAAIVMAERSSPGRNQSLIAIVALSRLKRGSGRPFPYPRARRSVRRRRYRDAFRPDGEPGDARVSKLEDGLGADRPVADEGMIDDGPKRRRVEEI